MGEWQHTTVGELIEEHGGSIKTGPFGTMLKAAEYSKTGVPLISVREIGYGNFIIDERTPYVAPDVTSRLPEYILEEGDIVFARKGAVDRCALVQSNQAGWFLGSDGIRFRPPSSCNSRYLLYLFQNQRIRDWIIQNASGTTMASLNQGTISRIPLTLPPLAHQKAISEALGSFDDKIELNRRMSRTLEAMARALFKSWFVDFDPVRANAEGRSIGLSNNLSKLFPDGFDDSELPNGWSTRPFADLFDICGGSTPRTENATFWGGHHQWATPKDLSNLFAPVLLNTGRQLSDAGLMQANSGLLPPRSLLLSTRAPIGYMAFITQPTAINQGFAGIVRRATSPAYAWAWCHANMEMIRNNAGGSTFPEISKAVLRQLPMLSPPQPVLDAFGSAVDPLIDRLIAAAEEDQNLADLRDTLLPKLISGELRIADAETRIAAA